MLVFLREIGAIDNISYRQLTGSSKKQSGFDLRELRKKEIIEQKQSGKSTYYLPSSFFITTMVDKDSTMVDKDSINEIFSQLPPSITEILDKIGRRSQDRNLIPDLIIQLCSLRELSISELAILLKRNEKYIKTQYIQPLIEAEKLTYTIPAMISHPDQKYRSKSSLG